MSNQNKTKGRKGKNKATLKGVIYSVLPFLFIFVFSFLLLPFSSASIYDDCSIYGNCKQEVVTTSGQAPTTLNELTDVSVPSPADDTYLYWNNSQSSWMSKAISGVTAIWQRVGTTISPINTGDTLELFGNLILNNSAITNTNYIQFNTSFVDGQAEGRLQWNQDDGTLEVGMPGGNVNLQIGEENLIRVVNDQGSQINNGQLVRISGGTGNFSQIKLADKSSIATAGSIGFATEDITNLQLGFITNFGMVREINTSGMTAGSLLWLGNDGAYTTTVPTAPEIKVIVGVVIREHATEGIIFATIQTVPRLVGLSDVDSSGLVDESILKYNSTSGRFEIGTDETGGVGGGAGEYSFIGATVSGNITHITPTAYTNNIIQFKINSTSPSTTFWFEAEENSTGIKLDTSRKIHSDTWYIIKNVGIINDNVLMRVYNSSVDENFNLTFTYN